MTASRWADIERLYHAARERAPQDRAAFLNEACAGDDTLRHEVESLLANETAAGGFLEGTALSDAAQTLASETTASTVPSIAGYTILKTLGEGGMGVVYLAEQVEPIRRLVALKLIKHGMDSRQVVARFEAERQALAMMHHPHIAAVFDAGTTTDGRPYFVMEYVEGVPITDYCDRHQLSTRARLELFLHVCAALQHAHQKGVIHRDLKPSNILVSEQDGQPLPKVIDFGIAKAIDSSSIERAAFTELGMMVGTPEYMSPEQAALSPDIDTATDVYSLGVVLYELLVGALPFDPKVLRTAGYDEMRRMIREDDPPRPSTRLTGEGGIGVATAAARKTDAARLAKQLRGDLDLIALKALEKDRHRRYDSIGTFAADIGRYLADEPIAARPRSAAYRMRKFTRRYRAAVMGAAAVFLVLIAGLTASTVLYLRAEGQRREAEYRGYVATIAAADGELRSSPGGHLPLRNSARARLLAVPDELRGWEWHHLILKTDSSLTTLASDAPCVRPAVDGLVRAISDNVLSIQDSAPRVYLRRCETLEMWDGQSRTQSSYRLPGRILAVSSSGEALVVVTEGAGKDMSWRLRLLDTATLRMRTEFGPFQAEPICAAINRRATRIAVGTRPELRGPVGSFSPFRELAGDVFNVFDGETGREIVRLAPPRKVIVDRRDRSAFSCNLAFSPDSTRLATSGAEVHVWRADTWAGIVADDLQAGYVSQPIAWNGDGSRLAIGRLFGLVDVVDLSVAPQMQRFASNGLMHAVELTIDFMDTGIRRKDAVLAIAFAPDGRHIVTGRDTTVGVWDVAQRTLIELLPGHSGPIVGVAFDTDGRFVTADTSGHVKVWRTLAPGATVRLTTSGRAARDRLAMSADGSIVATMQFDGGVDVWHLADLRRTVPRPPAGPKMAVQIMDVALGRDGRHLVVEERERVSGVSKIWTHMLNLESGGSTVLAPHDVDPACRQPTMLPYYREMTVSPDGRSLAYRHGNCLDVRDLTTWNLRARRPTVMGTGWVFHADGSLLYPNYDLRADGTVVSSTVAIWDWERDRVLTEIPTPPVTSDIGRRSWLVRVSPDGHLIALVNTFRTPIVSLWDGGLRREVGRLPVPSDTRDVAFSQDGRRIATSGVDSVIHIWDVERRQLLLTLTGDDRYDRGLRFTPDGDLVVQRSSGGLAIWEAKPRESSRPR